MRLRLQQTTKTDSSGTTTMSHTRPTTTDADPAHPTTLRGWVGILAFGAITFTLAAILAGAHPKTATIAGPILLGWAAGVFLVGRLYAYM